MSKGIAKSPEMIAKEAEIKVLVAKIKKTRTSLKGLKTRLNNSQQDFVAFQTRMQTEMMSRMEKVQKTINEIVAYAEKLKKATFLSKADKIGLREIIDMLGGGSMFGKGFEEYQEQRRKAENGEFDFDENARAKARDLFKGFNVEPPKEEQRKIRQVFILLSSKFHPDKARNDKDRADFHILMQEINTAYQNHDIDKLLEIERMYVHSEAIDLTGKAVTVDVLTEEVNRLKRELEFLEAQVERTSGEIKNFRKSDLGQALTKKNRLEKEGGGIDKEIEQIDKMAKQMNVLHEALKDSWEQQYMSPKFYESLTKRLDNSPPDDFEDDDGDFDFSNIFEEENAAESDINHTLSKLFDSDDLEDVKPIKNPRFKKGDLVKVAINIRPDFHPRMNLKGFGGKLIESYLEEGEERYVIEFDQIALEKLTPDYVNDAIEAGHTFDEYTFGRTDLKNAKLVFDEDKVETLRYKLTLQHSYAEQEPEIRKVMIDALTQNYEADEAENWLTYFENKLRLPVHAKSRGLLDGMPKGTKIQIIKPIAAHQELGFIFLCLVGKQQEEMPHPLMDLAIAKKADKKMEAILEAYSIWVKEKTGF